MQRNYGLFAAVLAASLLAGCAARQRTATRVPTGPVYTGAPAGVIPAGTQLVLRTNERISTDRALAGTLYSAEVARAIVDSSGNPTVPAGAPAQLMVVQSNGSTLGSPDLELGLRSITVNGRRYDIDADTQQVQTDRQGLGANRRTAQMVGGGALLGTIIGAIAGGGAGAAVGAAAGAVGGGAVQVLTKGNRIQVPAETLLTFRLDNSMRLRGYRR